MTAQVDDVFRYRGETFGLVGISEGTLFAPSVLGMAPRGTCTACWRGYVATFALSGGRLVLDALDVELHPIDAPAANTAGPVTNGVAPAGPRDEHDWFNNHYDRLNYPIDYTGGLLLAADFIEDLYVHMGFHPAWKYKRVFELIFQEGVLADESDRSEQVAAVRKQILGSPPSVDPDREPSEEEIREFVEQAFDRTYDRWQWG